MKDIYKGITHAGVFHADDVFATALLKVLFPKIEIERVKSLPSIIDKSIIVYDIGFGEFDHHQQNAKIRNNGVKYSSFGLLWREYGKLLLPKTWIEFDKEFVVPIDIQDNGGKDNPLSKAIKAFNPNWDDAINSEEAFEEAVGTAKLLLEKVIEKFRSEERASSYISDVMKKSNGGQIIVLDKFLPWQKEVCKCDTARYVIFPSVRGGWNAQAVPKEYGKTECRQLFPKSWLEKKPQGIVFIHPMRFLITVSNKATAIKICKKLLKEISDFF